MGAQQIKWKKIMFTGGMNLTSLTEISWKLAKSKELGYKDFGVHCTLHITRQTGERGLACKWTEVSVGSFFHVNWNEKITSPSSTVAHIGRLKFA
jgi:hypothetical protein